MSDDITFNIPKNIIIENKEDNCTSFSLKPLEQGYGTTIGNALRRVLLSSLEGYAIVACSIPNIHHEFSTIEGVIEDVSEIILNLKKVKIKALSPFIEEKIEISINNQKELKASDILQNSHKVSILNPSLVICRFAKAISFEISLIIQKGKGYRPAEEHNFLQEEKLGIIPMDATFTPIKKVSYTVEDTRVGKKIDYDHLLLSIQTDGTLESKDALKYAVVILQKHFDIFLKENIFLHPSTQDEEEKNKQLQLSKLLKTPLSELNLTSRAFNSLASAGLSTFGDVVKLKEEELNFKNFGKKSYEEIQKIMQEKNLHFGMDIQSIIEEK